MCFNIEEHIYGLIIVTLILIILIGCSIYLHKKKNIASNTILSIWSISLSAIAIIVTMVRVDVYFTNDTFVGIMAGFIGACATIVVGAQIYNSIETSKKIKEIEELQRHVTEDIEFLKKERKRGDHFTMYGVNYAIAVSNQEDAPSYSFILYIEALINAINLNNSDYIANVLGQLEIVSQIIIDKKIKHTISIPPQKAKQIKNSSNASLILKELNTTLKKLNIKEI